MKKKMIFVCIKTEKLMNELLVLELRCALVKKDMKINAKRKESKDSNDQI
jgi:hypothetical protein